MKIKVWEHTAIQTYAEVVDAYRWCHRNLGEPGNRWTYGKDEPDFLGNRLISSPEEIDFFEFYDEQDAIAFKLKF